MSYEFLDHTADVAVELRADTREGLFMEALLAFTDTVTDLDTVQPTEGHDLEVEVRVEVRDEGDAGADGLDELLVEWLGELVYRFDVDGLLFSEVEDLRIEETGDGLRLTGRAHGEPYDEERHPLEVEVKGVTYHGLEIGPEDDGWRARVLFDV